MTNEVLSTQQLSVICALSTGASMTAAAEEAGVHRNTIQNWLRNVPPFQQALADAQYARALYFREKIEQLVPLALQALNEILTDPKTPTSVRLRAALAIAQLAARPPEPQKQRQFVIAFPENRQNPHNPAQSRTTNQNDYRQTTQ